MAIRAVASSRTEAPLQEAAVRTTPGPFARVRTSFAANRIALAGLTFLVVVVLMAIGAPLTGRYDPTATILTDFEEPPSEQHWLGTDNAGRDVWSRLVWGSRNSLSACVAAVVLATTIGVLIGAFSGYHGGFVDGLLMRVTDAVLAFPGIVLLLMLASILGPSIVNVVFVIGFLGWPGVARLVRGLFLSLRERDFALAARALGATNWRIIRWHLLPHVVSPVVVSATFGVAAAVLTEAALSYLGLGVRPPAPSWGVMLADAQTVHVFQEVWWSWLAPGITLVLLVLAVNYVGETLRRALDPYGDTSG
jgi:peptide/nickel transport system permease protein